MYTYSVNLEASHRFLKSLGAILHFAPSHLPNSIIQTPSTSINQSSNSYGARTSTFVYVNMVTLPFLRIHTVFDEHR